MGSRIGNELGGRAARGAPPVDRFELMDAVLNLHRHRLHEALCALWPDNIHAGRAAAVIADALELRHPIIDDQGRWHAPKAGGRHQPHGPEHRLHHRPSPTPVTGAGS